MCKTQRASFRIWTRVTMSISEVDNRYATSRISIYQDIIETLIFFKVDPLTSFQLTEVPRKSLFVVIWSCAVVFLLISFVSSNFKKGATLAQFCGVFLFLFFLGGVFWGGGGHTVLIGTDSSRQKSRHLNIISSLH